MGKRILGGIMALLMTCMMTVNASASEIGVLLDKLVEKGILSGTEAQLILEETKAEVAQELVRGEAVSAPSWTQKINIKQDVRLRYQYQEKIGDAVHRDRARVRYRLGVEGNLAQNFKAGAGLATGNGVAGSSLYDNRSTNETLDNSFEHPDILLDYAYGKYSTGDFAAIGGKFIKTDFFWAPTDMLWDTDINPEGAAIKYDMALGSDTDWFNRAGFWIIDEISASEDDPYVVYYQGGLAQTVGQFDGTLAGTLYGFEGVKGRALDFTSSTNTTSASVLSYDYDSFGISGEVGWNGEGEAPVIPRIALIGDYIQNTSNNVPNDTGWSFGGYIGHKKIAEKHNWQFKYLYTDLEKDAWLDAFPDSDRYSGGTDIKGSEFIFSYGLAKNVSLDLDYYQFNRNLATSNEEYLFQADLNFKF